MCPSSTFAPALLSKLLRKLDSLLLPQSQQELTRTSQHARRDPGSRSPYPRRRISLIASVRNLPPGFFFGTNAHSRRLFFFKIRCSGSRCVDSEPPASPPLFLRTPPGPPCCPVRYRTDRARCRPKRRYVRGPSRFLVQPFCYRTPLGAPLPPHSASGRCRPFGPGEACWPARDRPRPRELR